MAALESNLLLRLHKWASRQDENFLTEAFAHLLIHLLEHEREAAVRLLQEFTRGFFSLRSDEARLVDVRTQVILEEGTPDLEIRTPKQLAYVEVKAEGDVNPEQLGRYRRMLRESGVAQTALILLTRYHPGVFPEGAEQPDCCVRWYQLGEWLAQERARYVFEAVSDYLVNQFLDFLGARNMIMGQVTWHLSGGVRALRALVDMLNEAAVACGLRAAGARGTDEYMGLYLENRKYWIGIYLDQPELLTFETYNAKIDPEAAKRLEIDGVTENRWQRQVNLESEEVHFFARPKASQMLFLEEFLRDCLSVVQRIEVQGSDLNLSQEED